VIVVAWARAEYLGARGKGAAAAPGQTSQGLMIRFFFRFLATVSLAVAVVMAVIDATRTVAAGDFVLTPLGTSWMSVSSETLEKAQDSIAALHPVLWDPIAVFVLKLPGFVVFAVIALLLYAIGRRPARRLDPFAQRA
jgi:hypothetical protein